MIPSVFIGVRNIVDDATIASYRACCRRDRGGRVRHVGATARRRCAGALGHRDRGDGGDHALHSHLRSGACSPRRRSCSRAQAGVVDRATVAALVMLFVLGAAPYHNHRQKASVPVGPVVITC